MVVISSCNSGTGTLNHGEGVMSLARGFFLAGASSVIMSGWAVNDEVSREIISSFYYHLSQGSPKNEAMRLAKIEYMKTNSSTYSNPYYWAPYEVLGDNSKIVKIDLKKVLMLLPLILLLPAVLTIYYLIRRSTFKEGS